MDAWPSVHFGKNSEEKPARSRSFLNLAPGSFGQEGEGKLESSQSIATTTQGHFVVADEEDIKFYNPDCAKCLFSFCPEPGFVVKDVTTDNLDNLYVLFFWRIYIFDNQANKRGILYLKGPFRGISVTVNEEQNVFVLAG